MPLLLTSTAFAPGQSIPKQFTDDGKDISPPLEWNDPPANTKQFAVICDDPDAPTAEPWVHWVLYNIPPDTRTLPEGVPTTETLRHPEGAAQGCNSWGRNHLGYRGPAPPHGHGVHHYHFRLYALDAALNLKPGGDKSALLHAIDDHILAEAELIGTYRR